MNRFFVRRFVIQGIFIAIALILLSKLFYIQIIDKSYFLSANNNVLRKVTVYPSRGVILDRKGKILVQNQPVYDLMVIPNEVKSFDTLEFCRLVGIDKKGFKKRFKKAVNYSPYKASIFEKQLSAITYATFQEKLFQYHGFFVQNRTVRYYPDSMAAQFLGYIGEVTERDIKRSDGFYSPGDYIGVSGVERAYEDVLRGKRGVKNLVVDAFNRSKGSYANGQYDTLAISGANLISSLDRDLQKLGEKLMTNKIGSIVAIEPSTGEILAFVSSPTYDPNEMVGRQRGNNYMRYLNDPYKPLLIRPTQAYYSPGSSFKPVDALIALQEGIISPETTYYCPGGFQAGNHWVGCEHVDGPTDLTKAIAMSCNTYFCYVLENILNQRGAKKLKFAYDDWKERVNKFGFGEELGIDLPNEKGGFFPSRNFYDKMYPFNWNANTIISLAIGQGELSATPLQMANIEAIIANHGFYYKPHLIKAIGDRKVIKKDYVTRNYVDVDPQYFEPVIDGMQEVVETGTARASKIPDIVFCGKTGTVQNSHGKNHSVFVGFAPRENPKIAIAVVVENGGYGSAWAAPIASFMVEKYLKDSVSNRPSGIKVDQYIKANLLPGSEKPDPRQQHKRRKHGSTDKKPSGQKMAINFSNKAAILENE